MLCKYHIFIKLTRKLFYLSENCCYLYFLIHIIIVGCTLLSIFFSVWLTNNCTFSGNYFLFYFCYRYWNSCVSIILKFPFIPPSFLYYCTFNDHFIVANCFFLLGDGIFFFHYIQQDNILTDGEFSYEECEVTDESAMLLNSTADPKKVLKPQKSGNIKYIIKIIL